MVFWTQCPFLAFNLLTMFFSRQVRWRFKGFILGVTLFLFPLSVSAADFTSDVYDGVHKVNAIDTEHFTVEFSENTALTADEDDDGIADVVELIAEYAEYSWEQEVEGTDLPDPLADQDIQEKIYLILDDTSTYLGGALGVTSLFTDGSIYFAVDPQLTDSLLAVTVAHEFLHAIQFSYQGYFIAYEQDINFAEMTATWAEELVYSDVNDYIGYLSYYFADPDYSVFTGVIPEGSLFEYALSIWPIFLSEYFDDWSIMPAVLNAYFTSDPDIWDSYEAYQSIIEDEHGADLREVYQAFALWNYVRTYYIDGTLYPEVSLAAYHLAGEYPLTEESVDSGDWPALFGANYLVFEVSEDQWGSDFELTLTKPEAVDMGVVILPESADYYLTEDTTSLILEEGNTSGTLTIPIEEGDVQFTVILTPVSSDPQSIELEDSPFEIGYQYSYSVRVGDFTTETDVQVEETVAAEDTSNEGDEDKEGDAAGENAAEGIIEETDFDELSVAEVAIMSQTTNSVTLKWTRPSSDEIAGYYVYYGTESGVYDYVETIEGAHITHVTLDELFAGTYYFAVTAYTLDGEESSAYSNEVTTSLETRTYSDVTSSEDNYYAIRFLSYLGVLEGYSDETFRPEATINRAEMMKIMVGEVPDEDLYGDCFDDVTDEWFAPYVCYAKEQGWVEGFSDGLFHPERTVSRAEALKMILKSFEIPVPLSVSVSELPYDDVVSASWFASYIVTAYDMGILEETGAAFDPNEGRTRGEVSEEIFRLLIISLMLEDAYSEEVLASFLDSWGDFFL